MPRSPRLHVPDGFYHAILRGNNRQPLFFDDDDRRRLDGLIAIASERYGCRIHAYCWMTNHLHIAVQIGQPPLGRFVQWVASQYARTTNRRHGRTGHLFERRYRALLVEQDSYLLQLVRYIHLNPVAAGLVRDAGEYQWSSHRVYLGCERVPWLSTSFVLSQFADRSAVAKARFVSFICEEHAQSDADFLDSGCERDRRIIGSEGFLEMHASRPASPVKPSSIDELVARTCIEYQLSEDALASSNRARRHAEARACIAWRATNSGAATLAEVARRFKRTEPVLCRAVSRYRRRQ
jgi:putative transposase